MRRHTTALALVAATAASVVGLGAGTANATTCAISTGCATTATFSLTAGSLSITVPAGPVALSTVAIGAGNPSGQLGTVAVSDQRANLLATWTTTVTSTAFTTGTSTTNETVPNTSISYSSGVPTTSGLGTFTPSVGASIGTGATAVSLAAGSGVNTASWNPTITFNLAAAQVAGTYSGTITHSVA